MTHGALLVGLGAIGMGYDLSDSGSGRVCTHARAFAVHEEFHILGGVDQEAIKRRALEGAYGVPAYDSLDVALTEHQPNVVVIATPTTTHADILHRVLERCTPKAILCEKPLAQDVATAKSMLAACDAKNVQLFVNYMRRADPGVAAVKQMLASGEIEAPIKGVVWYSKGLIHNGSHFVDLARHWFGPVLRTQVFRVGRRWADHDPEPDFALEYAACALNFVAANEEFFSHYTIELIARNGRLRYEDAGERVEWQAVIGDPSFAGYKILSDSPARLPADMRRYQWNVAEQLALALDRKPNSLCSGSEAIETLRDVYGVVQLL